VRERQKKMKAERLKKKGGRVCERKQERERERERERARKKER
jgi:hypothetical protein